MQNLAIVIPTLNAAATLSATLNSLRPLIEEDTLVIVVDSFSTDGTRQIAETFGIHVEYSLPGNMYEAVNRGLSSVDREWCTYVNGDDILYPDAVRMAIKGADGHADVIYGSVDYVDEMGRLLHSWNSPPPEDLSALEPFVMPIPQLGTIFRKTVFAKLNGFDTRYQYSSDFDFFVRARIEGFRFGRLMHPRIGAFRLHATQISQKHEAAMRSEVIASATENRVGSRSFMCWLAYAQFRMRNWDSYLLRFVRKRHLQGRAEIGRTIDF
jgi:glycosyltransferase involved in cell wall biosynthesis